MFRYKVSSRLLPPLRLVQVQRDSDNYNEAARNVPLESTTETSTDPTSTSVREEEKNLVKYPLFKNIRSKGNNLPLQRVANAPEPSSTTEPLNRREGESELDINIDLDFGWMFGWLERAVWITMFGGIIWALSYNFYRATRESCTKDGSDNHFPFNVLPSLSRSMSSFRVGKFLWTICMAAVFVARLLSNHFLHRLYDSWYAGSVFNKIFLWVAYGLDTLEILSLIMIPAFSLDCDPTEHAIFFVIFISLTYTAELFQYFTRFLKRKKNLPSFSKDVKNYYRQIGILILCQTFCILFMFTGYFLHVYLCRDFYYSIFTLGEYLTVIINVRFKRDTVLFVK